MLSVKTTLAFLALYNFATSFAFFESSLPTTIRSGLKKSSSAVPSRRNSGFETIEISDLFKTSLTFFQVLTGTVDLITNVAESFKCLDNNFEASKI